MHGYRMFVGACCPAEKTGAQQMMQFQTKIAQLGTERILHI